MGTDDLIFLLASDWFVAHADVIGLLPGLDQDGVEEVSVAARMPVQRLIAQADDYYEVSFEPARIAASAAEFLDGCRQPAHRQAAAALLARFGALDRTDLDRMRAWLTAARIDGNEPILPAGALAVRDQLDALVDAGKADFTSWDESLDLFRAGDADWLRVFVRGQILPWRVLDATRP